MKMKYRQITLIVGSILALLAVSITLSSNWQIRWWLIGSGGGVVQESGRQLVFTVGQPVAGETTNGYTLNSGFHLPGLPSGLARYEVMLPTIMRSDRESLQKGYTDAYLHLREDRLKLPAYGTRDGLGSENSMVMQPP